MSFDPSGASVMAEILEDLDDFVEAGNLRYAKYLGIWLLLLRA